jgi:hypothetical protein
MIITEIARGKLLSRCNQTGNVAYIELIESALKKMITFGE